MVSHYLTTSLSHTITYLHIEWQLSMEQNPSLNWPRDDFTDIKTPFEKDLLNRKPLAEHLTRYIDRLQVGAVLALDARRG